MSLATRSKKEIIAKLPYGQHNVVIDTNAPAPKNWNTYAPGVYTHPDKANTLFKFVVVDKEYAGIKANAFLSDTDFNYIALALSEEGKPMSIAQVIKRMTKEPISLYYYQTVGTVEKENGTQETRLFEHWSNTLPKENVVPFHIKTLEEYVEYISELNVEEEVL